MEWASVSQRIWDMKYRFREASGAVDADLDATWWRIARALAAPESNPELWAGRFHEALSGFKFLPAGRVIAGAGTGRSVTLFNCFVMGTIADDMSGIFENLREAALTMQQGGGIGHDFSTLRPQGAPVKGVGADASGPLSFMDVWDSMCRTIMSAGSRRGAMMATLRCDHPDIEAFVDASRFPLPQQDKEAKAKRRIGLGVTGLADALIFCGVRYGSPEAVKLTREWLGAVQRLSYLASADIAAEKGSFPLYDRARYLA